MNIVLNYIIMRAIEQNIIVPYNPLLSLTFAENNTNAINSNRIPEIKI